MLGHVNSGSEEFRENRRRQRLLLSQEEIRGLCVVNNWRSAVGVFETLAVISGIVALATFFWHPLVLIPAVILIGSRQQALFVLVHDAAHYRLFKARWLNDIVGRVLAMPGGISMCTYRVVHRLHHNHLFEQGDPDMPLIAGYPRGRRYLLVKLAKDLSGLNAWKSFKYFFGAPVINDDVAIAKRPLDDTAPKLRKAARYDRWWVVAWHAGLLVISFAGGWLLEYLVLWLLPLATVMQVFLRLRALLEHGAVTDPSSALRSARTNVGPRWLMWFLFPHCVNYHIEHHLFPAIPFYNLPKCHALMAERGVLSDAEVRSVPESLSIIMADRAIIN
ncbi:fatty acid desaturase family protein [Burkholderiales bacterium]|nr:fatty acid desaturase family protein [Burkholderiales bacterium]